MKDVSELAGEIVDREGGYVADPDDPGGATKYGVTIHTMRALGLDLDGSGWVDAHDVRRLSREQAVAIFVEQYFDKPGLGRLPKCLHASVFDMYVNAGSNAIRILQQLLCEMGYIVTVDAMLGPQTVKASVRAAMAAPDHLADAYGIARRNYYFRLADRRPKSRKYARSRAGGKGGWIRRAEEFITPRYHLSDAEFQARVAAWG